MEGCPYCDELKGYLQNEGMDYKPIDIEEKEHLWNVMAKKSTVNKSGNYTKPTMRKRMFNSIKASAVQGTAAGKWSARKAQLLAKRYKAAGGGYR